jgi:hypothetical protein
MYWLAAQGNARQDSGSAIKRGVINRLSAIGSVLFVVILMLQMNEGVHRALGVMGDPATALENRHHNLRTILAGHPEFGQATIIADPDYLLETLPYYVSNPTYLMREHRYGNVVHFTSKAQLTLSLGDVLANARWLREETGRPVLILLSSQTSDSLPTRIYSEGYNWKFSITREQALAFHSSTRFLGGLRAPSGNDVNDEGYSIFVMDR